MINLMEELLQRWAGDLGSWSFGKELDIYSLPENVLLELVGPSREMMR